MSSLTRSRFLFISLAVLGIGANASGTTIGAANAYDS